MSPTRGWPSDVDYLGAIQAPQVCFIDQRLKDAWIRKNDKGLPLAATGRSAIVFRADVAAADVALRCFTREAREAAKRYQELHAHVAESIPRYMVDFKYWDREIRVRSELYPVVEMGWAEGQPLHLWVERHLQYPRHLVTLAATWFEVIKDLQARDMAHGDLSSDNCLVTGRNLKLIDYDGFYIPELAGSDPGEAGNPNFQHPGRAGYYAPDMDAFPALVIYLSLLALAADRSLWRFFNGRNLIFTTEDYLPPHRTPLWTALASSPDRRIAPLLTALADMCGSRVDALPRLSDVAAVSSIPRWRTWLPVPETEAPTPGTETEAGLRRRWPWSLPLTWPRHLPLTWPRRQPLTWKARAALAACAIGLVSLAVWLTSGSPASPAVRSAAFSPDGTTLAAADATGSIYLWDIPARKPAGVLKVPTGRAVSSVAFSPDGTTLATADADGDTYLWNLPARSLIAAVPDPGKQAAVSAAFSPDGTTLATADAGGSIYVWDITAKNLAAVFKVPTGRAVSSVAFSPDGKTLATADADGGTYLWDIPARKPVATLPDPRKQAVASVAFSPDGTTLATADTGGGTYLWDIPAAKPVATLPDPGKQAVVSVAFSPDGKTLATVDAGSAFYFWPVPAKPPSS